VLEDLAALLERKMQLAQARGDDTTERSALLRLAAELPPLGHSRHALLLLGDWLGRHPEDTAAALMRAERAFDAKDYQTAASASLDLFHAAQGADRKAAALRYAQACEAAGEPFAARTVLEQLYHDDPTDAEAGVRLKRLYEDASAFDELAELLIREADAPQNHAQRHSLLLRAADMLLKSSASQARAVQIYEAALALQPEDHQTVVGLSGAYTLNGNIEEACALLEAAIKGHGKRRSRELSELQHAMSRVAQAAGDDEGRFAWLDAALQSDRRNGDVASELAVFAMDRNDHEVAVKALQLITLLKEDCSMSRAEAYLRQAIIAQQRSDLKKAALLAKRALATDPDYVAAKTFLNEIGPQ
jgi:tetratricopeptide (TPR) repeat protein